MMTTIAVEAAEYQVASWRCGTGLVKAGDSRSHLIKRCGKADGERRLKKGVKAYTYVGKRGPTTVVTVEKGVVTTITQHR
ncbi:DUF2845 domain-containing protein [Ferrimonas senticii]|uniref:DUF2845 domain-containing protein n=1 Tax=Ferrimonas senticii TaxID=394566 RepID=UPI00146AB6F6|nr:DUF2845 domain-containing protein [Ferrimonas senticii]